MNLDSRSLLTNAFCGALVALYAGARFNTPNTNRSSTVQLWYWQGLLAYVAASLALFSLLSVILEQTKLREFLLNYSLPPKDAASASQVEKIILIPPALAATLIMTTLLPSVPFIKRLDETFLRFFLRMACIPAEVIRRGKILHDRNLRLTATDLDALTNFIHGSPIPNEAAKYLRVSSNTPWEISELHFTKILLLFVRLNALQEHPKYSQFFSDNSKEYARLRDCVVDFISKSAKGLAQADRLRSHESKEEYEEIIREKREAFKLACIERFDVLGLFLARAVLQSELSEKHIQARLRSVGFESVAINRAFVPVHQLATLSVIVLVYMLISETFIAIPEDDPRMAEFKWLPFLISLAHVTTIGFTLWFMQRFTWARRTAGSSRPIASYILCGVIAAGLTSAIWIIFDIARIGTLPNADRFVFQVPFLIICGLLCSFVAYACDDVPPSVPEPMWFRCLEALGCALAMILPGWLITQLVPLPEHMAASQPNLLRVLLPAGTALVVGFYIPTIYRTQDRSTREATLTRPSGTELGELTWSI